MIDSVYVQNIKRNLNASRLESNIHLLDQFQLGVRHVQDIDLP